MLPHSYATAEKYILYREFFGMKLGLDNITAFLALIGNPQNNYKTIHISGTNGKGSCAAMLASVLKAQGYKTGLFTSPHLVSLRERMRVNDKLISEAAVDRFIKTHKKELSRIKLSFFELITAMAFDYFNRSQVDIAVIETGLGGRFDATNVLKPALSITTQISKDHVEILGKSLTKIAREKAGIMKPGCPHVVGCLPDKIVDVFQKQAKEIGSVLKKISMREIKIDHKKMSLSFRNRYLEIKDVKPSLVGIHQLENTAVVLKAVSELKRAGVKLSNRAVKHGLENTYWKARFQIDEFKTKPTHIYDVSHNASGVEAFVSSFENKFPNRKAYLITGFVKRKEHQKMFNSLSRIASYYALVPLKNRRSSDINELIKTLDFKSVAYKKFGSLKTAYSSLLKQCQIDDIIIILGSHYLVGEFFKMSGKK